ncbi:hypothetical protein KEM48_006135 [Puccinia striiformis f. sp. tritici PST-130]|nr:hypothetical protein KEM48_006135 [Puccinia striiformis f. sp. tritici PST-130]
MTDVMSWYGGTHPLSHSDLQEGRALSGNRIPIQEGQVEVELGTVSPSNHPNGETSVALRRPDGGGGLSGKGPLTIEKGLRQSVFQSGRCHHIHRLQLAGALLFSAADTPTFAAQDAFDWSTYPNNLGRGNFHDSIRDGSRWHCRSRIEPMTEYSRYDVFDSTGPLPNSFKTNQKGTALGYGALLRYARVIFPISKGTFTPQLGIIDTWMNGLAYDGYSQLAMP